MMPLLITLLTDNQIGDAGATQLAGALQRNSTLTVLNLYGKHDMIYVVVCHYFHCHLSFSIVNYCYYLIYYYYCGHYSRKILSSLSEIIYLCCYY